MLCDYHVHSYFSDDSNTPLIVQAGTAIHTGLDEICFTEHVDYGIKSDMNYPAYFREIERARSELSGKITIRSGLEFGVQTHTAGQYEKLFAQYRNNLDFILLSVHQVNNLEFWNQRFQRGKSQDEYNRGYYEELLRVVKSYHDYSVLAHLDLMTRYDMNGAYPFEKVRDIIAEILTTAIHDGKGIELNTSSWRYGLHDTQPSREILELYRDLGGEIITIGSDAHNPEYVGAHIDEGQEILRGIGFVKFCTFEGMRPEFHAL